MWPNTTGKVTPLYLAKRSSYYLPQFRWYGPLRPMSPDEVFDYPAEMSDLKSQQLFGPVRPDAYKVRGSATGRPRPQTPQTPQLQQQAPGELPVGGATLPPREASELVKLAEQTEEQAEKASEVPAAAPEESPAEQEGGESGDKTENPDEKGNPDEKLEENKEVNSNE